MTSLTALYTDGGVIGRNPSAHGGTWAYCLIDAHQQRIVTHSGVITPAEAGVPAVTNNLTALRALVAGLEAAPRDVAGVVASDSWVSLQRVFHAAALRHVPVWLRTRLQTIQRSGRLARMTAVLLDGHPTRAQLAAGRGARGRPVSPHNVWCDAQCRALARAYARAQTTAEAPDVVA
jgi:ribonuclease HI